MSKWFWPNAGNKGYVIQVVELPEADEIGALNPTEITEERVADAIERLYYEGVRQRAMITEFSFTPMPTLKRADSEFAPNARTTQAVLICGKTSRGEG